MQRPSHLTGIVGRILGSGGTAGTRCITDTPSESSAINSAGDAAWSSRSATGANAWGEIVSAAEPAAPTVIVEARTAPRMDKPSHVFMAIAFPKEMKSYGVNVAPAARFRRGTDRRCAVGPDHPGSHHHCRWPEQYRKRFEVDGIAGPTDADKNLSLKYFLNGALVSDIVIDTPAVATDTVDYIAIGRST